MDCPYKVGDVVRLQENLKESPWITEAAALRFSGAVVTIKTIINYSMGLTFFMFEFEEEETYAWPLGAIAGYATTIYSPPTDEELMGFLEG